MATTMVPAPEAVVHAMAVVHAKAVVHARPVVHERAEVVYPIMVEATTVHLTKVAHLASLDHPVVVGS